MAVSSGSVRLVKEPAAYFEPAFPVKCVGCRRRKVINLPTRLKLVGKDERPQEHRGMVTCHACNAENYIAVRA